MNDAELARLLEYLRNVKKWSTEEIYELLHFIATGKISNP